jgi:phage-related protein
MKEEEIQPVEVFAGTVWQVEMVKSLLENAEIEAFLQDEIMGMMNPWWSAPGGAGSIRVIVSSLDYEKAKLIVEEYEKNQQ